MRNFNPYATIYNNITRYAKQGNRDNTAILPCIIRKVYKNLKADIYIPYTSSVMESIPIIFDSMSEEQGNINMPEEDSLSLFITSSDGRKFVMGGLSLADSYLVRDILPGEAERYVKNSIHKQDLIGNHIFSSGNSFTNVFGADGINQFYSNGEYKDMGNVEKYVCDIRLKDGTTKHISYKNIYSTNGLPPILGVSDISSENEVDIKNSVFGVNENIINKALDYLVEIQNLKQDINDSNIEFLKDNIRNKYKIKRNLIMTIEEGCAVNKKITCRSDLNNIIEEDFVYGEDGSPTIYRVRIFDNDKVNFSLSVTQLGNVYNDTQKEEIIINHNSDDFPIVECRFSACQNGDLRHVIPDVMYSDRDTLKIRLKGNYGGVESIQEKSGSFTINFCNKSILYVEISRSMKKTENIINCMLGTK